MDVVVAVHAAAAVLLIVAGLAKIFSPMPMTELLVSFGLPELPLAVVVIGLVESGFGILALAVGGPLLASAIGVLYLGFFAVVWRALAIGAPSCGCFGRFNSPPSPRHLVSAVGFAAVSFVAVVGRTPVEITAQQPLAGVGFVLGVGVIAGLAMFAFTR